MLFTFTFFSHQIRPLKVILFYFIFGFTSFSTVILYTIRFVKRMDILFRFYFYYIIITSTRMKVMEIFSIF